MSFFLYRYLSVYLLVQRNKGLCSGYPFNLLYIPVKYVHKVFVVPAKHFYKNGPISCSIMAFQYLSLIHI